MGNRTEKKEGELRDKNKKRGEGGSGNKIGHTDSQLTDYTQIICEGGSVCVLGQVIQTLS